ncbi:hypothetical protein SAMN05444401_1664 [Clostridium amylolyticum]|uniref:Peptidase S9 prolyl oligopeptidase catalytic domain-containing protein n=1 Tax=Clostridium amylolyticum TaxID=1121298 RepID=A0A1M6ER27_9CLOT|nr:alpha/beta fold hydrolase [Clostridium amylolyticum]SHI87912.1 hypothetical protein SAMN05444401_1664 [Clostridium amylolyticum]
MLKNESLSVNRIEVLGIPCIVIKEKKAKGKLPTVFLYHGWSSQKENHTMFGETLALYGYMVIIPDALYHGERGSLNYDDATMAAKHFWEIVFNNIEESEKLIKMAVEELGADEKNMALLGHSMGGFSAAGIFTKHPEIKTVININGSFAYEKAEKLFLKAAEGFTVPKEHLEELRSYDPTSHKESFNLRPILMLHGEADAIVPIESQEYFYNEILEYYKEAPEKLEFTKVPRLNHYITIGMVEDTINWFNNHLMHK